jgi:hypothetical protein
MTVRQWSHFTLLCEITNTATTNGASVRVKARTATETAQIGSTTHGITHSQEQYSQDPHSEEQYSEEQYLRELNVFHNTIDPKTK